MKNCGEGQHQNTKGNGKQTENYLKSEQVNGEPSFVCWSNNAQSEVDDSHVTTFCVFAILTYTFCHID